MAAITIAKTKSGTVTGYNVQWYDGKKRRSIYLNTSRYSMATAERFKEGIETLLYYQRKDSVVLDPKTEQWLTALSDDLKSKLEQHGLIAVTKQKTCRLLWDTFLKYRTDDVKPRTIIYYLSCRKLFDVEFSPEDSIEVITPDRLLDWRKSLLSKYAKAGVSSRLKVVNTLLNWAVDHDWLSKNPMQKIPRGSFVNRDKDRIISMEEYAKLLNACPNQEYRTIIALARIGGLRCPSELKLLRWSDIKWEQNRFVVQSLKTEHHARHRERTVPLFSELRHELERHFSSEKAKGNEFVIQGFQGTTWGLYKQFQAISRDAGLGNIVRPFDNMRMSRSNEVVRRWGETRESLWIGHTDRVRQEHYFRLNDEDFSEAAGKSWGG